ncbi:MAG: prepilin peptidase [Tepidisphaerales bacterium]
MLIAVLVFVFLLGLCVGSFLNVVVYRLPRGESLIHPPSRCPSCERRLAWYDNVPVLGWLKLRGRCRWCRRPISPRYPIVEAATGLLFAGYAAAVFVWGWGPCPATAYAAFDEVGLPVPPPLPDVTLHWPLLVLHLGLLAVLLAASLIDLETFTIPGSLPLTAAVIGLAGHTLLMSPGTPGQLHVSASLALPAAGAVAGYLVSLGLFRLGVIPLSFPDGEPMLLDLAEWEAEMAAAKAEGRPATVPETPPLVWTRRMLAREMLKEIAFLLPPVAGFAVGAAALAWVPAASSWSAWLSGQSMVAGFLGAALGAMVGGGFIWLVRIAGTLGFGKLAMGLGDVHLMAGVGAVVGGVVATSALFLGAVVGLVVVAYGAIVHRQREVPFGPYLAAGTLLGMVLACPLSRHASSAWDGFVVSLRQLGG